jgi:hypothetical protein
MDTPIDQTAQDVRRESQDELEASSDVAAWNEAAARVLDLARELLGPRADAKLAAHPALRDTLVFDRGRLAVGALAKWTVEAIVKVLCADESNEIAGPIMVEAAVAAADLGLPAVRLDLERTHIVDGSELIDA